MINNQLICPLLQEKDTLSHPGTRRYAQTMQQCSLAVPGRVCLHTGTRHTRTHTITHTKYSHIKLQLCALKSGEMFKLNAFDEGLNTCTNNSHIVSCLRLQQRVNHFCSTSLPPARTYARVHARTYRPYLFVYITSSSEIDKRWPLWAESTVRWLSCSPELSRFVDLAKLLCVKQRDEGGDGTGRERYG